MSNELVDSATQLRNLIGEATAPYTKGWRSMLGFTSNPFAGVARGINLRSIELVDSINGKQSNGKIKHIIDELRGQLMVAQTTSILSSKTTEESLNLLDHIDKEAKE